MTIRVAIYVDVSCHVYFLLYPGPSALYCVLFLSLLFSECVHIFVNRSLSVPQNICNTYVSVAVLTLMQISMTVALRQ